MNSLHQSQVTDQIFLIFKVFARCLNFIVSTPALVLKALLQLRSGVGAVAQIWQPVESEPCAPNSFVTEPSARSTRTP